MKWFWNRTDLLSEEKLEGDTSTTLCKTMFSLFLQKQEHRHSFNFDSKIDWKMQSLKQIEIIYLGEYEEDEVVGEEEEEDEDEEEDEYAQFIRAIIFTHFLDLWKLSL